MSDLTYEAILTKATESVDFRAGLLAAAAVCRSNDSHDDTPPCPARIAAVYIERLAAGEMP